MSTNSIPTDFKFTQFFLFSSTANFPPEFVGRTPLVVTGQAGTTVSIDLLSKDLHVPTQVKIEVLTYDLNEVLIDTHVVSTTPSAADPNLYEGVYLWDVPEEKVRLKFKASDLEGAMSVIVPELVVCVCMNDARCNYNIVQVSSI